MSTANILYIMILGCVVALVIQFNELNALSKRDETFAMRMEAIVKEVNDQGVLHGQSVKATADVLSNLNLGMSDNYKAIMFMGKQVDSNIKDLIQIKKRYVFNKE